MANSKTDRMIFRANARLAQQLWGSLSNFAFKTLKRLTENNNFSIAAGDLSLINGRWYVTHTGLLRIASRRRCAAIETSIDPQLSIPTSNHWIFKATVYKSGNTRGFTGYGDANPSNVSPLVRGAEMRVAETRAVNRALRKAYGIGLCSVEELGWSSKPLSTAQSTPEQPSSPPHRWHPSDGGPRLRDQLCLLIRQHNLDPTLVKAYAADFCGTQTLKDASRDLVQSFITHIGTCAEENRDGLICKLNSYARPVEVNQ